MTRWLNLRAILMVGSIMLVLATAVAIRETERFRRDEYGRFVDQSLQLASVFARSASVWLTRGNDDALEFAANLLLAGSGQYVRIVVGNETILDERLADPGIEAMDLRLPVDSLDRFETYAVLRRGGLDVAVPIASSSYRSDVGGIVHIGFADNQAAGRVRSYRVLVFGAATGAWFTLLLAAGFAVRIRHMRSRLQSAQFQDAAVEGMIQCGVLTIDTEACAVLLGQESIELTPKTFELLVFLARHEGKTFSDDDLLAALWSDASYAASGDVRQCIYLLRRRLGIACADPKRIIVNVKGFGYKLAAPADSELTSG